MLYDKVCFRLPATLLRNGVRYSHVLLLWAPLYRFPRCIDNLLGNRLGKYTRFCLVIIDDSHYGRFWEGTGMPNTWEAKRLIKLLSLL